MLLNRHMTQPVTYSKPREMVERSKITDQIYVLSHAMKSFLIHFVFQLHCWEHGLTRSLQSYAFWADESKVLSREEVYANSFRRFVEEFKMAIRADMGGLVAPFQ